MGITVVKRKGKSFKDKLYLPAIASGMMTTLRHFRTNFKDNDNLKTRQYPEIQPDDLNERYRGVHRLTKHDDGSFNPIGHYLFVFTYHDQR